MLPRALLAHADWTHLPATARVIFMDICKIHHHGGERRSTNNGQIGYGCAAGSKAANVSITTAYRMLEKLRNGGLLKLRRRGAFRVKAGSGRTSEWEITIFPIPGRASVRWGSSKLHVEHWLLDSPAYKALSSQAKCILIELMRRYDGGNNGHISFGGRDGACTGFSTDVTEHALTELERAGFTVQTEPAVPNQRRPRKWRVTIYRADGKPATKNFMRAPAAGSAEKSCDGFTGAVDSAWNVSMMRASLSLDVPSVPALTGEIQSLGTGLHEKGSDFHNRADETIDSADTRSTEIHLEASPPAEGRLTSLVNPVRSPERSRPAPPSRPKPPRTPLEQPASLFGDALPSMSSPMDQLRAELRAVLSRSRGAQSRLAEVVGLSRSAFAHALSGREKFAPVTAAVLRKWLDGQPMTGDWPPIPPAREKPDAA